MRPHRHARPLPGGGSRVRRLPRSGRAHPRSRREVAAGRVLGCGRSSPRRGALAVGRIIRRDPRVSGPTARSGQHPPRRRALAIGRGLPHRQRPCLGRNRAGPWPPLLPRRHGRCVRAQLAAAAPRAGHAPRALRRPQNRCGETSRWQVSARTSWRWANERRCPNDHAVVPRLADHRAPAHPGARRATGRAHALRRAARRPRRRSRRGLLCRGARGGGRAGPAPARRTGRLCASSSDPVRRRPRRARLPQRAHPSRTARPRGAAAQALGSP